MSNQNTTLPEGQEQPAQSEVKKEITRGGTIFIPSQERSSANHPGGFDLTDVVRRIDPDAIKASQEEAKKRGGAGRGISPTGAKDADESWGEQARIL